MGQTIEIPVSNGFYVLGSLPLSHQECTNWVPIVPEVPTQSQRALVGTPGLTQIATSGETGDDINRGAHVLGDIPYFVNGSVLYKLDRTVVSGVETFDLTSLGGIESGGRVSMSDNGTQLMILNPGGKGYIYTIADGLLEIIDADFRASGEPQYVVFIDGYFACSTDSKKWIISNLNDGLSWDALDFGTAESDPDPITAPVVHNNQIFMTGSETTEAYQNLGGAGFPFQRSNIFLDKGCFSPFTLISTNQQFFMIGGGVNESPAVWSYRGARFVKVSTLAIDGILNDYTQNELEASFSLSWAKDGQYFVSFSFTDRTFVYNMTTNMWHEQKSGISDGVDDTQERWRVNSLVTAYGYTIVADSQDGRIGILDTDVYQEYGTDIIRIFSTQPLVNKNKSFRLPRIELVMEAGIGDGVEQPKIGLAISENSKTFDYERVRDIGKIGEYGRRTIWRKNGRVPRLGVLRFRLSDPVKPVVIKLEVDIS